jgi:hypothetical protein
MSTGALHEYEYIHIILLNISRSILLRMRNVSKLIEKIKTQILYGITFYKNHTAYNIMWKNIV